uniref:Uncharacterized protein n=1 Tax=Anguilla anguilla TaxID=7936 RepID=A0A0E9SVW5_ANGAN
MYSNWIQFASHLPPICISLVLRLLRDTFIRAQSPEKRLPQKSYAFCS